ncbi:uncharacterized protein [Argopecten irradians]|uniref:uncharacterized protein n=1 Tax=Argopecten irradians TaxID=31199 RepID=UPI00372483DE
MARITVKMSYRGTYPHQMIHRAQDRLAKSIWNSNNPYIKRVLYKCGVSSNGNRGFDSRYKPVPHNNLWHEDALKYRYTFPWSDGYNEYHGASPGESAQLSIHTGTGILHNELWKNDTLGSTECGFSDFTSSPAGSSALGNSKSHPSRDRHLGKESNEKRGQNYTSEGSRDNTIIVPDGDYPAVFDLTSELDESLPTGKVTSNESNTDKRNPKRKHPMASNNESPEIYRLDRVGNRPSKRQRVQDKVQDEFHQGLVCDYCGYVVVNKVQQEEEKFMMCHFSDCKHNSASFAKIKMSDEKTGIAVAVIKESVLMVSRSKHAALVNQVVPMCPEKDCNQIHESIWTCAKHYEMCHSHQNSTCYGLANVVSFRTIVFSTTNICSKCHFSFDSSSAIHKHWERTGCLSGFRTKTNDKDTVTLFFCSYCNSLHPNFASCRTHIIKQHNIKKDASMNVVVVEATTAKLELLPIEPRSVEDQAQYEKGLLSSMKRTARRYGFGVKATKKHLKAEHKIYRLKYPHIKDSKASAQDSKASKAKKARKKYKNFVKKTCK